MQRFSPITGPRKKRSFTLVEMLVSMAILVILLGILFAITNSVSKTVLYTSTKIDAFAASRAAFDLMSQKLSQASLNTYWDYDNPAYPTVYYRQSDLQFLVRQNVQKPGYGQEIYFASPSTYSANSTLRSTDGLLNACSFFVEYCPDTSFKPGTLATATPVPATHYRYRLMQGLEPTENLSVYGSGSGVVPASWPSVPAFSSLESASAAKSDWTTYWTSWATYWNTHEWATNTIGNLGTGTTGPLNVNNTPLANNVIALIVCPRLSPVDDPPGGTTDGTNLTPNYLYDSQANALTLNATTGYQPKTANQLPPTVQLTMIVISEASAVQLEQAKTGGPGSATPPTVIENILSATSQSYGTAPFQGATSATYTQYQTDLSNVTKALAANHITFQIFTTTVTMKESKWSDYSQ